MKYKSIIFIIVIGIILVGTGSWVAYYYLLLEEHNRQEERGTYSPDSPEPLRWEISPPYISAKSRDKATHLYFSDLDERFLTAEERVLPQYKTPTENAEAAIAALIAGPKENLSRTIPKETKLLSIYLTPNKTAYVDFDETITEKHPGGSTTELLTIYSIVNTLTLNFSEIENVKILIRGRERKVLAAHVSIQQPLSANLLLIR
jgi:spore germination protein GerM